jgi:hypothetical protein
LRLDSVKTIDLILNLKYKFKNTTQRAYLLHRHNIMNSSSDPCGVMGTIYQDHTGKPLADLNLDYRNIISLTHNLNKNCNRRASTLIITRYALQYNLNNHNQDIGLCATAHNPPDPR